MFDADSRPLTEIIPLHHRSLRRLFCISLHCTLYALDNAGINDMVGGSWVKKMKKLISILEFPVVVETMRIDIG